MSGRVGVRKEDKNWNKSKVNGFCGYARKGGGARRRDGPHKTLACVVALMWPVERK